MSVYYNNTISVNSGITISTNSAAANTVTYTFYSISHIIVPDGYTLCGAAAFSGYGFVDQYGLSVVQYVDCADCLKIARIKYPERLYGRVIQL